MLGRSSCSFFSAIHSATLTPLPRAQVGVQVLQRLRELILARLEQLGHPGQRYAGLGQGPDPDQSNDGVRVVPAVARAVARRLRQQPALVVVADRADGHAREVRHLGDRQH